jgi:O-antigen/teichoic acid export membrane protein
LFILSIGEAVNGLAGPTAVTLSMTGHQRDLMFCSVGSATVTVVAELVLGSRYGINGVAAASAGGVALLHTLLVLTIRRRLGIWTVASFRHLRR